MLHLCTTDETSITQSQSYRWQGLNGPLLNHRFEEVGFICPQGGSSALLHQRNMPRGFQSTEATGNSFRTLPRQQKAILENPEAQTSLFSSGNQRLQPNHQNSGRTEGVWLFLVFSSSAAFPFGAYSTEKMMGF